MCARVMPLDSTTESSRETQNKA
jgi:hypothetical protein